MTVLFLTALAAAESGTCQISIAATADFDSCTCKYWERHEQATDKTQETLSMRGSDWSNSRLSNQQKHPRTT
jgi:hypothetical protein